MEYAVPLYYPAILVAAVLPIVVHAIDVLFVSVG